MTGGVKLLVAGAGLIGARHVKHIRDHTETELVGVIDPVAKPDDRADVPWFSDFDEVSVEADGIVIATPTDLHAEHAELAAARGWHMLIEKPIASDEASAARIVNAAKAANVNVLVGHHRRYHPRVARLKELIGTQAIGRPVIASVLWAVRKPDSYFDVAWRQGREGAPIAVNLIHDIDLLRYFFGEVESVAGTASSAIRGADRIESGGIVLGFRSGVIATVTFADTTPSPWGFEAGTGENPNIATTSQDMMTIMGTMGSVSFPSLTLWTGATDWSEAPEKSILQTNVGAPLDIQLSHFAAVVAGREAPVITADDATRTLQVILQIEEAVALKRGTNN